MDEVTISWATEGDSWMDEVTIANELLVGIINIKIKARLKTRMNLKMDVRPGTTVNLFITTFLKVMHISETPNLILSAPLLMEYN